MFASFITLEKADDVYLAFCVVHTQLVDKFALYTVLRLWHWCKNLSDSCCSL